MNGLMAISDIHGRYDELITLLGRIKKQLDNYKLILVGDYIGYGPNSIKVLELVKTLVQNYGAIALLGNWEDMVFQAINNPEQEAKDTYIKGLYSRGGKDLYHQIRREPKYLDLINTFPLYHIEENIIFSHSGIDMELVEMAFYESLEVFMDKNSKEKLIWNFEFYEEVATTQIDPPCQFYVIAGHTPINKILSKVENPIIKPYVHENVIGIDFGASSKKGHLGVVFIKPYFGCLTVPIEQ